MHWLQLKKEVADAYPRLKNSHAGYNYIENNMEMCEYYINAIMEMELICDTPHGIPNHLQTLVHALATIEKGSGRCVSWIEKQLCRL